MLTKDEYQNVYNDYLLLVFFFLFSSCVSLNAINTSDSSLGLREQSPMDCMNQNSTTMDLQHNSARNDHIKAKYPRSIKAMTANKLPEIHLQQKYRYTNTLPDISWHSNRHNTSTS